MTCEQADCDGMVLARGLCARHYARWYRHGDPATKKSRWDGYDRQCDATDCERKHFGQGFCRKHYREAFPERADQPWNERRRANYQKRRALKKAAPIGAPVLLEEIRQRDGNRCGICGKAVNGEPYPHPLSASLDHMVPLSEGGAHDPTNIQLSHLQCNVNKGVRGGGEQLRIV